MSLIHESRRQVPVSEIQRKEFPRFSLEVFSRGKRPGFNEDKWVATPHMIGVIDGSTAKTPYSFNGVLGGEFASSTIASLIKNFDKPLYGVPLVDAITEGFNEELSKLAVGDDLAQMPAARPSADFAVATLVDGKIFVTQVSDVAFRVNGKDLYDNPIAIDRVHTDIRIGALRGIIEHGVDISKESFLQKGLESVADLLQLQGDAYQNNPDHIFGYGVIDGRQVPSKFVKVYAFDASEVDTIEFFSDGYFKRGSLPTVESWEKAFAEVEAEDPYKMFRYPAVKGSLPGTHLTDDRTILIAKFKRNN